MKFLNFNFLYLNFLTINIAKKLLILDAIIKIDFDFSYKTIEKNLVINKITHQLNIKEYKTWFFYKTECLLKFQNNKKTFRHQII